MALSWQWKFKKFSEIFFSIYERNNLEDKNFFSMNFSPFLLSYLLSTLTLGVVYEWSEYDK